MALAALAAAAQDDPPGRVGRLADMQGSVSWWDDEAGQWAPAERNRPLTGGDRIATAEGGRAELRVGSTVLRLGSRSELDIQRLDDERIVFRLHTGKLAVRVRTRETADELELLTDEARFVPLRAGHYRLDRIDDTTQAGSWRGELRVDEAGGFVVGAGQRIELYRQARTRELRQAWIAMADDGFSEWVMRDDQRDDRSAASRFVSPEMTGAEDLDRYGRWDRHPEYGAVWLPDGVGADWAPYRDGRWAWVAPWGWTWVDAAPWGFAPFHYGRWVSWRGGWGWVPGAYVARPVFAPALVAWIGGGSWGLSLQIGGPHVGWVPLAPREPYVPHYRASPRYVERINVPPPYRWKHPPGHVPTGPVMYGNQGVPNAVTVVPRDVLVQRQPVARGAVDLRPGAGGRAPQPVAAVPPPAPPARVAPPSGPPNGHRRVDPPRDGRPEEPRRPAPTMPSAQPVQPGQPYRGEPREVIDLRRSGPPATRAPAPTAAPADPPRAMPGPAPAPVPAPERAERPRPAAPPAVAPVGPAPTPAAAPPVRPTLPRPPPAAEPAPSPAPAPVVAPAPGPKPAPERARERDDERKRHPDVRDRDRDNLR
ncbi:MAG: hypothetical protein Q8K96_09185 [Rubrivivax sp.]|nr:hypothetical protein [Rubrivivax sp.]